MVKIKKRVIIIGILLLIVGIVLGVEGTLSSVDLDNICNLDFMVLYRFNGTWLCGQLPQPQVYIDSQLIFNGTLNGTTGYIAQWQNGTTLNDSNIFEQNKKIGINTTQPNFTLSVVGNASFGNSRLNISSDGIWYPDGTFQNSSRNGTVTSISQGTGLFFTSNPLTVSGTIHLSNATGIVIGGVRVSNCSQGQFISGYDSSMSPICGIPASTGFTQGSDQYCNPQNVNEYCKFYDFGGGDFAKQSGLSSVSLLFDSVVQSFPCGNNIATPVNKVLNDLGYGSCTSGFYIAIIDRKFTNPPTALLFESPTNTFLSAYCNGVSDVAYNCSKVINTSNIIEMSWRFSNNNLSANPIVDDNITMIIGYFQRNVTTSSLVSVYLPNGLQNMIAFYHYSNQSNWTAITMLGGNGSNQTTVLPLDFNSTKDPKMFNAFRIIRENTTGNMLFYINETLSANHSTFIPDWVAYSGFAVLRHSDTISAAEYKFFLIDWAKYYHKRQRGILLENFTGSSSSVLQFVKQISLFEGLSSNESPIVSNATLMLNNASELFLGGVHVFNCSSGFHVSGWFGNMTPFCSGDSANGTVTSLTSGEGIVLNPVTITGVGVIMGANATTSTRGIVQVINCTGTDKVSGWSAGNIPACTSDATGGTNFNWTFVDRVYESKTKTNVGTSYVDVYNSALDPEDTLINTTGNTQFRIIITVDYISAAAATESVSFNQTTVANNKLWEFNFTSDCDPCDSNWQNLPSWASPVETFVESQIKSTTAADDPVFRGFQIWLR